MQSRRNPPVTPFPPPDFGRTVMNVTTSSGPFVTLAWTASATSNVTGYKLHYGTASGAYNQHQDVGNTTTAMAVNLIQGVIYYFAATAYTAAGAESGYSNEVAYSVPVGPTATPGLPTPSAPPTPVPSASPPRTPSPTPGGPVGITFWANSTLTIPLPGDTLEFTGVPNVQPAPRQVWVRTSNSAKWGSSDNLTWLDAGNVSNVPNGKPLTVKPNAGLGLGTYTGDITISATGLQSKPIHARLVVSNATPGPSATPPKTPTPAPTTSPSPSATQAPTASPSPMPSVSPSPSVAPSPSPSCSPCPCPNR